MGGAKHVYKTANPFEQRFGYSRGVRKGPFIAISGTTALKEAGDDDKDGEQQQQQQQEQEQEQKQEQQEQPAAGKSKVHFATNALKQATLAMNRCVEAVVALGGDKTDIVRVRMFVSRHEDCEAVGKAMHDVFIEGVTPEGEVGIAATMVVMNNGFVDPDILVEVEVEAYAQ